MVIDEGDIRKRIQELEDKLEKNVKLFPSLMNDAYMQRKLTMQSFNIESQLYALHFVLNEKYEYKHM